MAEQLASVPEENTIGFTAPYPVCNSYRESIRSVRVIPPEWLIRSTPFSQSGQSGSNYSSDSGALSSYFSNNSDYSSGSDFGASELTKIADKMASDGYTQRMVQAFGSVGGQGRALHNWFVELDVDWVLEIHGSHGLRRQLQLLLQDTSASWHQELVERWIRALTIIVVSIKKELVATVHHETSVVALFGKASISAMLIFVEAILDVVLKDNVQTVLHMYICVSSASYEMCTMHLISPEAQSIFNDINSSLDREGDRLIVSMVDRMWDMMILIDGDDTWCIEVPRGGGEVHRKTRVFVDCIVLMRKAQALTQNSARSRKKENLRRLIDETISYMKDMLLTKSKLCSDPSLRYLFLLNNSYFITQVSKPSIPLDVEQGSRQHSGLELPPECEKYMNMYLDVSWGHVSSCIPKSNFHGPLQRWKNTSSLAKFESAFHKIYQAQKFWKVPEPQLRDVLRKTITQRVISGYRDYLKEHLELAEHVSRGSSSPEVLEQMLGELFEG